tara:strand:+ start:1112 stop:1690 length:579 start_codon:yes stop_codon:yes gene_type:complete
MIKNLFLSACGIILFYSCAPTSAIKVQKDPYSGTTIYSLEDNFLDENYPSVNIEFDIQKSITKTNSHYHILLNVSSSETQFIADSVSVFMIIDKITHELTPVPSINYLKKNEFDSNLFSFFISQNSEDRVKSIIIPISLQLLKNIAYGIEVQMKLEGNQNIIKAYFSLENKINIQKFIESFVPLEEQLYSYP